jgi:Cu/Ag efflux pump CusA
VPVEWELMNFENLTEALISLCSVPFALVGRVWLMALLYYNISTVMVAAGWIRGVSSCVTQTLPARSSSSCNVRGRAGQLP